VEAACRWVGAIAPLGRVVSSPAPRSGDRGTIFRIGLSLVTPQGSRLHGSESDGDVVSACQLWTGAIRFGRDVRAPDPLRRWLREPKPVARSLTLRPIPGHRRQRSNSLPAAALAEARIDPRTQGTRGNVVFSDGAARAPEERLAPTSCRGCPRPAPAPESIRASGVVRRTVSPASPGVSSKAPAAQPSDGLARSLLPEDAEARCVERERASPTCQRAPGRHVDLRGPGTPGSRERRASRRVARFSRFAGGGVGVLTRYLSARRPLALRESEPRRVLRRTALRGLRACFEPERA